MNAALTRDALEDALKRNNRSRDTLASMDGCVALDAIRHALAHLSRAQSEILAGLPDVDARALESVADMLCDMSSNVAGHYRAEDAAAAERAAEPVRLEWVA